jgi:hypothetical protein
MPDPVVAAGFAAVGAYVAKDAVKKLLGPTAEYLGEGLRNVAQRRIEAIEQIFRNAERKLGGKGNSPGQVPLKVLRSVLDEGSFSPDPLAVEYFGGILASSRSERGRDDRGARMATMLDSLSTYQLRAHYLIYSSIRNLFAGRELRFNLLAARGKSRPAPVDKWHFLAS